MAKELFNLKRYVLVLVLLSLNTFASAAPEDNFAQIKTLAGNSAKKDELTKAASEFYKKYPNHNLVADVRLILADNEKSPQKAIEQYKILVTKYRYFKQRDYAQYRICEIYYLLSKWSELCSEAKNGISLFDKSAYFTHFQLMLAKAYIYLDSFEEAKNICIKITETNHDPEILSETLLLIAHINRNISGSSREYLYSLNELITGFQNSGRVHTAVYLLGRFYEDKKDYDKAFSAYTDVIKRFPDSPEATFAKGRIADIEGYNPVLTDYIPRNEAISRTENIDIKPEIDITEKESDIIYSISLGPFENKLQVIEIKNLIKDEFSPVKIINVKDKFILYVGRTMNADAAISTKIRLAEEFGINGNVVKMVKDSEKLYIYEE